MRLAETEDVLKALSCQSGISQNTALDFVRQVQHLTKFARGKKKIAANSVSYYA